MNSIAKFTSVFILVLVFSSVFRAAGVVDRSFGSNGTARTMIGSYATIADVVITPDNKVLAVLSVYSDLVLVRYLSNGAPDPAFGTNGVLTISGVNVQIRDVELQSDGKIVAAGIFFPRDGSSPADFMVMRIMPTGTIDPSFGNNGMVTINQGSSDMFNQIVLQPDGKIIAVGYTSDAGGYEAAFRFNTNGSIDNSFGGGACYFRFPQSPYATHGQLVDVKVLSDGRVLTGAPYSTAQAGISMLGYSLMMLTPQCNKDTTFGSQGVAQSSKFVTYANPGTIGFEVMPSGNIFIAYASGVSLLSGNGTFIRDLPFEGYKTQPRPNGQVLVYGDSPYYPGRIGAIKTYNEKNIIGKSSIAGEPFVMPDGRIIVVRFDFNTYELILTALSRLTSQGTRMADFDKDDRTDLAVMYVQFLYVAKSSGDTIFHLQTMIQSQVIPELFQYQLPGAEMRRDTIVYAVRGIPNVMGGLYNVISESGTLFLNRVWGLGGDIPTGGDFDGDGLVDMTVFRPSDGVWYSMSGPKFVKWGAAGDKPVPADYDYDGITDYAVFRPSTGTWWVLRSSDGGSFAFRFGLSTDIPLTGDYDGDGRADFTVYRPSEGNWYQYLTNGGFRVTRFGLAEDVPVPGDYDGDGRHDIAVYRTGVWYLLKSTEGFATDTIPLVPTTATAVSVRYDE